MFIQRGLKHFHFFWFYLFYFFTIAPFLCHRQSSFFPKKALHTNLNLLRMVLGQHSTHEKKRKVETYNRNN